MPTALHSLRKKPSGIWVSIPAPSPVSGSLPVVPLCSRLCKTSRRASRSCTTWSTGGRQGVTPVLQVVQDLEALLDRLARPAPVEPRYEPEPASIVLVHGVVKSGFGGQQAISPWRPGCEAPFLPELPAAHKCVAIVLHTSIW